MLPRCLPDASQMPPRCFPDNSQMLPRCFPDDASQLPPRSQMSRYASEMPPRSQMPVCFSDVSQVLPSSPLTSEASQVTQRDSKSEQIISCFYCLKLTCKIVAKSCQNQCQFGHFFASDFTENHVHVDCSFACPF